LWTDGCRLRGRQYVPGRVPDLYLRQTAATDPATGNFLTGRDGQPTLRDIGVLVRRDDMLDLEVIRKCSRATWR
jgi:hypothetical protein